MSQAKAKPLTVFRVSTAGEVTVTEVPDIKTASSVPLKITVAPDTAPGWTASELRKLADDIEGKAA